MDEDKKIVIRNQILQNLEDYGISWDETEQKLECEDFKSTQLKLSKQTNPNPDEYYHYVQSLLANPNEVNIDKINPYLIIAQSNRVLHQRLWAYALFVVSTSYGRVWPKDKIFCF